MEEIAINRERLADTFKWLVETDSVSREEGLIAGKLERVLKEMGATVTIDDAGEKAGSDTGNLIAAFPGDALVDPIVLCAHMDTVEPGRGVKAILEEGIFRTDGTTILGGDDKSAIAIILEVVRALQENKIKHAPIEVVLTICEEIGLLGAKNFDVNRIKARFGYILDFKDTDGIVTKAPFANHFKIKVHGKAAHAGMEPEKGINALWVAAKAIAELDPGRVDHETTYNIGLMKGGTAINIVPDLAVVTGEARGHDLKKLGAVMEKITGAFEQVVADYKKEHPGEDLPFLEIDVEQDFPGTHIPEDHQVVTLAKAAAAGLGMKMETRTIGGGADANIFFGKGIVTGVLGTGMTDVHTVNETIALDDMEKSVKLLLEIVRIHSEG